jgi:GNAT superfamily N-acetyltransferase
VTTFEVRPFQAEHLSPAAALLAARHRADRARLPFLPARFESEEAAREALDESLSEPYTAGAVALQDGRMLGFVIGGPFFVAPLGRNALYAPPRSAWVDYAAHAAMAEHAVEVYRALYAALAPGWVAAGCFTHMVEVPAADRTAAAAWRSLGFGLEQDRGVRDTSPVPGVSEPDGWVMRRAGPADVDAVMRLAEGMSRHHALPPAYLPYLHEALVSTRAEHEALLADPDAAYLLASRDGRVLAMQVFSPLAEDMYTPARCLHLQDVYTGPSARGSGISAALLDRGLAWARQAGYDWVSASWRTANLPAYRTWHGHGFVPVRAFLRRVVDERTAWART